MQLNELVYLYNFVFYSVAFELGQVFRSVQVHCPQLLRATIVDTHLSAFLFLLLSLSASLQPFLALSRPFSATLCSIKLFLSSFIIKLLNKLCLEIVG